MRTRRFWNLVIAFTLMGASFTSCGGDSGHDTIIYSGSGDAVPAESE